MFEELKDFITLTLARRLSSPFISTFLFSWSLFNYDLFIVAFSGAAWDMKLSYIQSNSNLFEVYSGYNSPSLTWVGPLFITFIWVFLWPKLDRKIYKYTKEEGYKYKVLQIKMERQVPATEKDLENFWEELRQQEIRFEEKLKSKDNLIDALKSENRQLNSDLDAKVKAKDHQSIIEGKKEKEDKENVTLDSTQSEEESDKLKTQSEVESDKLKTQSEVESDKLKTQSEVESDKLKTQSEVGHRSRLSLKDHIEEGSLVGKTLEEQIDIAKEWFNENFISEDYAELPTTSDGSYLYLYGEPEAVETILYEHYSDISDRALTFASTEIKEESESELFLPTGDSDNLTLSVERDFETADNIGASGMFQVSSIATGDGLDVTELVDVGILWNNTQELIDHLKGQLRGPIEVEF